MTKFVDLNLYRLYQSGLTAKRETAHAAGYDLKVAERTVIATREIVLVPTGVKAYMQPTEWRFISMTVPLTPRKRSGLD